MTNNLVDVLRIAAAEDTCRNPGLIHRAADEIERLVREVHQISSDKADLLRKYHVREQLIADLRSDQSEANSKSDEVDVFVTEKIDHPNHDPDRNWTRAIKWVRHHSGVGLGEAKRRVETTPGYVAFRISRSAAEHLIYDLHDCGVESEIRELGGK